MPKGSTADVASERAKKLELEAKIAELKRKANQVKREHQRAERARAAKLKHVSDVAFALYVHNAPNTTAAMSYLAKQGDAAGGEEDGCTAKALEERYLQTPLEDLLAVQGGKGGGLQAKVHQAAAKFLQEFQLHSWVAKQNVDKGVAPSSRMVVEYVASGVPFAPEKQSAAWKPGRDAANVKWVQRFRKRWSLRLGRFRPRERVPLEAMRAKVVRVLTRMAQHWGPEGTFLSCYLRKKGGHNAAPKWGPQVDLVS